MNPLELEQPTEYHGTLQYFNESWRLHMTWEDLDNAPHSFVLPSKVVEALISAVDRIKLASRKEGAERAAATRKANGVIPFKKSATG